MDAAEQPGGGGVTGALARVRAALRADAGNISGWAGFLVELGGMALLLGVACAVPLVIDVMTGGAL